MTHGPCKRGWEVEAFEDGRLSDRDRASFERHMEGCAHCRTATSRLRELGKLLESLPAGERTDLERRRARASLLARANETTIGRDGRRSSRWIALALVPAMALVLFLVARTWPRTPTGTVASTPTASVTAVAPTVAAPLFEVADVDHADYVAERADGVSRVALRSGSASFHVEHVKPGARFLVVVPDGEVEVRGTRFVVEVAAGRTRSVVVSEGVVAVRVSGFEGVLRAGERWPQSPAVSATAAPSAAPPPASPLSPSARTALGPAASETSPSPGSRFAEAMGAYTGGDYGEAERRFIAFARDFPTDTRVEDAMFLLADARARRGDGVGAREAARAYLRRFPGGLRAQEAARLANAPSPP